MDYAGIQRQPSEAALASVSRKPLPFSRFRAQPLWDRVDICGSCGRHLRRFREGEEEVRAACGAWWEFAVGAEMGGFAADLLGLEFGGEVIEGVFVLLAELGDAVLEAGLGGFFRFEER